MPPLPDCHTARSAFFALRGNTLCESVPLLLSFFRFSTAAISADIFNRALALLLNSPGSDVKWPLRYSIRHSLPISPENFSKLANCDCLWARVFVARTSLPSDDPVTPAPVLSLGPHKTRADGLIATNPSGFFQSFAADYRSHFAESRALCHLIARHDVSFYLVPPFVRRVLSRFPSAKPRKLSIFLRFTTVYLDRLADQCRRADSFDVDYIPPLIGELLDYFQCQSSLAPCVHSEIGRLLARAYLFKPPDQALISFLDRVFATAGPTSPYYAVSASAALKMHVRPVLFTNSNLSDAAGTAIPSTALRLLRAITLILQDFTAADFAAVFPGAIVKAFDRFAENPLFERAFGHAAFVAGGQPPQLRSLILSPLLSACEASTARAAAAVVALFGQPSALSFQDAIENFLAVHRAQFAFLDGRLLLAARQLIAVTKENELRMSCLEIIIAGLAQLENWLIVFLVIKKLLGDVRRIDEATAEALVGAPTVATGVREGARRLLLGEAFEPALDLALGGE
jgi:hypothetical protein